jgi:prepilin-type N-terminal cleavage/methylation domain-containing protein
MLIHHRATEGEENMRKTHLSSNGGGGKGDQGFPASGSAKGALGFTVIEVLVVIVIIAILMSMAIPGFARWLPNYRLKGAARDLYSNLQLAKSGAIRDRANWAVEFIGGNTYRVVASYGSDNVEYKSVDLPDYGSGVSFGNGNSTSPAVAGAVTADSANPIIFNSRGITTDEASVFAYLTNDRNTAYAVGTLVSGSVFLRKWNGSGWE